MKDWKTIFKQPPAEFRSAPLWTWNGDMTEARITEMLEQFSRQGMGGVFIHPRPGLVTEYLSDRWFELWAFSLEECKRLGLFCHIYDENSYPAGFAGGHVPARLPHATAQTLTPTVWEHAPYRPNGELLGAYHLDESGAKALADGESIDEAIATGAVLTLELRKVPSTAWTAWFPMPDVTRPEVAQEFIASTYEPYLAHFGEAFGKTLGMIFIDEPHLAGAYDESLQFSRYLAMEFRKEHGYDLLEKLADLYVDQEGASATRFDYYSTSQRLWLKFIETLYRWCDDHGIEFTGHFFEHEWPYPTKNPDAMEAYRWEHVPGIDLLAPQYNFEDPGQSSLFLLTIRQLNSVANQTGRTRRICETHGVGGNDYTFEQMKRLVDWLAVHGINRFNEHISCETISGARKLDHLQTFSDHSPWWEEYGFVNEHVARLSMAMSQGVQQNRALVIDPVTTGWIRYNSTCPPNHVINGHTGRTPAMGSLVDSYAGLNQWLCDHQVDYDLGNEALMRDMAQVKEGLLEFGTQSYEIVIVPAQTENWRESTLELMEEFLITGGIILALGTAPAYINGRKDSRPAVLYGRHAKSIIHCADFAALQTELDRRLPPRLLTEDGQHLPPLVHHQMRVLEDGKQLHLIVNTGHEPMKSRVRLRVGSVEGFDTFSGEENFDSYEQNGEYCIVPLELAPAEHVLWMTEKETRPTQAIHAPKEHAPIRLEHFPKVIRQEPNQLMLDYVDLTLANQTQKEIYYLAANQQVWHAHGFDQDVWDRAVQFRDSFTALEFGNDSGFSIEYNFEIQADSFGEIKANGGLRLAIEHPELYTVELNGQPVDFGQATRWLDETILAASISEHVVAGKNTVTLTAKPFHILCEVDRVYILGEFSVEPAAPGFSITAARSLTTGDWTQQGLSHYSGSIKYTATVRVEQECQGLRVEIPDWCGTVIKVLVDDQPVGHVAFPPYELKTIKPLAPGDHTLTLEVFGSLRNLMGPHFVKGLDMYSTPATFEVFPDKPINGDAYDLAPYGLTGAVNIIPYG